VLHLFLFDLVFVIAIVVVLATPTKAETAGKPSAQGSLKPASDMQAIRGFAIDRTEVTIAQFKAFADATGAVTAAEKAGGGSTYEAGWEQRRGWTWRTPFGLPALANEPAVHINFHEARQFCEWAGKRLPTDAEWLGVWAGEPFLPESSRSRYRWATPPAAIATAMALSVSPNAPRLSPILPRKIPPPRLLEAAYTERRSAPTGGFVNGTTYPYPTGASPQGANCLGDCGAVKTVLAQPTLVTSRGRGHAVGGSTAAGVNGLFEMGANVWEWVETNPSTAQSAGQGSEKPTRGGSWWYGQSQMQASHLQTKPADTSVVFIGFRCAKTL
jgi:formylglycine-generating enzyme